MLTKAPHCEDLKIVKINTDEKTKRHLKNLGILEGEVISVLNENSGNIILKVKEGRLALNKDLAKQIEVV